PVANSGSLVRDRHLVRRANRVRSNPFQSKVLIDLAKLTGHSVDAEVFGPRSPLLRQCLQIFRMAKIVFHSIDESRHVANHIFPRDFSYHFDNPSSIFHYNGRLTECESFDSHEAERFVVGRKDAEVHPLLKIGYVFPISGEDHFAANTEAVDLALQLRSEWTIPHQEQHCGLMLLKFCKCLNEKMKAFDLGESANRAHHELIPDSLQQRRLNLPRGFH